MAKQIDDDAQKKDVSTSNGSMTHSDDELKSEKLSEKIDQDELKSLGKVRDILFGRDLQGIDTKLTAMELRLGDRITEIAEEHSKKLEGIEEFCKGELDKISSALTEEKGERIDGLQEMDLSFMGLKGLLAEEVSKLQSSESKMESELSKLISKTTGSLQSEITTLKNSLDSSVDSLSNDKTDRSELAGILTELAKGLRKD